MDYHFRKQTWGIPELLKEVVKYSRGDVGDVEGGVHVALVVFFCKVPVGNVPFKETGYDDEPQNHQVDARKDFVHQRRLAHTKGQKSWNTKCGKWGERIHTQHQQLHGLLCGWICSCFNTSQQILTQWQLWTLLLACHISCEISEDCYAVMIHLAGSLAP